MRVLAGVAAAAGLWFGFSASAEAGILTVTYQGVVTSGFDQTGIFGSPFSSLDGDAFTAIYRVDTAADGTPFAYPPYGSGISGGLSEGNQSPVSATIAINGVSFRTSGNNVGLAEQQPLLQGPIVSQSPADITDVANQFYEDGSIITFGELSLSADSYVNSFIPSWNYILPFGYILAQGDLGSGYFEEHDFDVSTFTYLVYTNAYLSPTSVTVSYVPEPGVWILLTLGTGLVGLTSRRRLAGPIVAA